MNDKRECYSLVIKVPVPWSQTPVTIEASLGVAIWWGIAASFCAGAAIVLTLT